ncbi:hypothetical protein [Mycetocola zhujimingii]|uniref:Uncharacterized protein n=1 Tax=Mycetocola zhujimingii TaxID=2079792 RepID=A0A2U1TEQ0_9MICO|nr:hypothetical protein [Mycetocola zhujimingii]PWC07346.1 hypothetical protein DF223_06915 [Mycetocola zhujimingii]
MNRRENPHFTLDPEIASAIARWEEDDQRDRDFDVEVHAALAPGDEEREIRQRLLRRQAEENGFGEDSVRQFGERNARQLDSVRSLIEARLDSKFRYVLDRDYLSDIFTPQPPAPLSRDFWWAQTSWSHTNHFQSRDGADGLDFFGGPNGTPSSNWLGDTDLIRANFGAVAMFEITRDRIPDSPSGRWFSEPFVSLFGGLLGRTTSGAFPNGDSWSKCWLHLDQQLFHWGFGQDGPVPLVLGQAHTVTNLLFEENAERTFARPLGGFTAVPSVMFGGVNRAQSLWSRIEVRFDVQIEGAGSLLWCDPVVRLITHQWPLRVIA